VVTRRPSSRHVAMLITKSCCPTRLVFEVWDMAEGTPVARHHGHISEAEVSKLVRALTSNWASAAFPTGPASVSGRSCGPNKTRARNKEPKASCRGRQRTVVEHGILSLPKITAKELVGPIPRQEREEEAPVFFAPFIHLDFEISVTAGAKFKLSRTGTSVSQPAKTYLLPKGNALIWLRALVLSSEAAHTHIGYLCGCLGQGLGAAGALFCLATARAERQVLAYA
jgi:hypothetical protein